MSNLIDHVTSIITDVAATEILPRFGQLADHEVSTKTNEHDLVTVADLEAERCLTDRLPDLLPGSVVIGEEAVHNDPSILSRLDGEAPVWVIDPVDGTKNFASGSEMFRCMVALVQDQKTRIGWLHDPVGGATTIAEIGSGAWRGDQRLSVAAPQDGNALTGFVNHWVRKKLKKHHGGKDVLNRVAHRACCGVQYDEMVEQGADTYFAFYGRTKPWDHCPGSLIYQEAGGVLKLLDGRPYLAGSNRPGILAAPSEEHWEDLRNLFGPAFGLP